MKIDNLYVYCTNCLYGKELIEATIKENEDIPKICKDCYPYDFEDSRRISLRKNYIEKER